MEVIHNSNRIRHEAKATLMNVLKSGFVGIILGYILALLLVQWLWLEMRFNVGIIVPGSAVFCMLLAFWKRFTIHCSLLFILEFILLITFFSIYKFQLSAFLIIPACLLREGCYLNFLNLEKINIILGLTLLMGNFVWIPHSAHEIFRSHCQQEGFSVEE